MISDEQVRHALGIWYDEDNYARSLSANASSMRDMRTVLESLDAEKRRDPWRAQTYQRSHDLHGLFSAFQVGDAWYAARVWTPELGSPSKVEQLGIHATADAARAHCDRILAELEANSAEQLEACRR